MEIKTRNFGTIAYSEEEIITFPRGLVGFENLRRFLILTYEQFKPLKYLQSLDDPYFSFVLANPQILDPSYSFSLSPEDCRDLDLPEGGGVLLYIIVNLPPDPEGIKGNFYAPLVINSINLKAKQVILSGSSYQPATPIVLDKIELGRQ